MIKNTRKHFDAVQLTLFFSVIIGRTIGHLTALNKTALLSVCLTYLTYSRICDLRSDVYMCEYNNQSRMTGTWNCSYSGRIVC